MIGFSDTDTIIISKALQLKKKDDNLLEIYLKIFSLFLPRFPLNTSRQKKCNAGIASHKMYVIHDSSDATIYSA